MTIHDDVRQAESASRPSKVRLSNILRAKWRQKCRVALANHLSTSICPQESAHLHYVGDTLGLNIEPAEVRLIPEPHDGYAWSGCPESDHLFSKQLSKHSTGAYKELCEEVGESFEAVPASGEEGPAGAGVASSFTRQILQLQSDNTNLSTELSRLTTLLQESVVVRRQLEETVTKHKTDTNEAHERARRTQEEHTKLQQENAKLLGRVRRLTKKLSRTEKGTKRAVSALQRSGLINK